MVVVPKEQPMLMNEPPNFSQESFCVKIIMVGGIHQPGVAGVWGRKVNDKERSGNHVQVI